MDGAGLSRWACLDLDDASPGVAGWRVVDWLPEPRQALLEVSRRGFHSGCWFEPAPWPVVRRWAASRARDAGLSGIEVVPKGGGFNGVRAPLSVHPKTGEVYPLIDPESGEIATDPWALLASRRACPVPETLEPPRPIAPPREMRSANHRMLVEEIERYTRLRLSAPDKAIARCPFHDDRHPSLGVMGGFWRCCAGCGSGGLAAFRRQVAAHGW